MRAKANTSNWLDGGRRACRKHCLNNYYFTTWSHKNLFLCALFSETVFTYLTARLPQFHIHWVALKHGLNTWTLAHFYHVDVGTYCCVIIKLLQERIVAVQNSNIWGPLLKIYVLSCWICPTPNPTLNRPDSVNKCKTDMKTYLLMQFCHLSFLVSRFELFCQSVPEFLASQVRLCTPWATEQT